MSPPLRHEIVVCTKDRPEELADCLRSLTTQTWPIERVSVIDASAEDQSDLVASAGMGLEIAYQRAAPGLPSQRNLAIDGARGDIIHFVDDDVILEPDYLAAIHAVYAADPAGSVLGVGGLPTNLATPGPGGRLRRVLIAGESPGRVLASGRGVPVSIAAEALDVDWLSGCCMSFRAAVLADERFDDSVRGYALGEDLEMSYRVRQHGRLVVAPAARLVHLESPRNRWDRRRWARADVEARSRRVRTGIGRYRRGSFWFDAVAQLAMWTARGLRPGNADARSMARGLAEGLISVARSTVRGDGRGERSSG